MSEFRAENLLKKNLTYPPTSKTFFLQIFAKPPHVTYTVYGVDGGFYDHRTVLPANLGFSFRLDHEYAGNAAFRSGPQCGRKTRFNIQFCKAKTELLKVKNHEKKLTCIRALPLAVL